MLRRHGARWLLDWLAYYRVEPFGEEREDFRWAHLMALVYNRTRGEKEKPKTPEDYMPEFTESDPQEDMEDVPERVRRVFGRGL